MAERPSILVTNDDGYASEGLHVLADALEDLGDVCIVAPAREQSAVSHALTLVNPLRLQRFGPNRYAVEGTPTDCVTLALGHVMAERPPSLVVSGINFGPNMGADVHYSGTVSAAFEGVILGVPALAVSQQLGEGFNFITAAGVAKKLAAWILEHGLPADTLLNVNVPSTRPLGIRLTRLGARRYTEGVIRQVDPRGREIFWIGGGSPIWEATPGTDFHEVSSGWVSVTPLHLDMTDHEFLETLRDLNPPWVGAANGDR